MCQGDDPITFPEEIRELEYLILTLDQHFERLLEPNGVQAINALKSNCARAEQVQKRERKRESVEQMALTYEGMKERKQVHLQSLEERADMHAELKVEGIAAAEHKDCDVACVGDKEIGNWE